MKNSTQKTVCYLLAVFIAVLVVSLHAQEQDKGRLKKIVERIRKAGLHPREARYYKKIQE